MSKLFMQGEVILWLPLPSRDEINDLSDMLSTWDIAMSDGYASSNDEEE
jgi:hypothetical protein